MHVQADIAEASQHLERFLLEAQAHLQKNACSDTRVSILNDWCWSNTTHMSHMMRHADPLEPTLLRDLARHRLCQDEDVRIHPQAPSGQALSSVSQMIKYHQSLLAFCCAGQSESSG